MLYVKSCNVKHNFTRAVNSNESTKCNRKDLYAICSQLCSYVHLLQIVVYTETGLLKSPSIAHQPDGIHPVQIHLIGIRDSPDHRTAVSVIKRLSLYEFTLWGRDLAGIRCPY